MSVSTAVVAALVAASLAMPAMPPPPAPPAPEPVTYTWPIRGPLLRRFEPPGHAYGPGHRGIDIAAPVGSPVMAAASGVVAFAGTIAGARYLSIDHPDGVRTTYSWLSVLMVERGDRVRGGAVVARTGTGHPETPEPHLHLGARQGGAYVDPLALLGDPSAAGVVHLAPLGSVAGRPPP